MLASLKSHFNQYLSINYNKIKLVRLHFSVSFYKKLLYLLD